MADETSQYRNPLFKISGKNSFFEVFDNVGINKMYVNIQIYDESTHKTTHKVQWYIDYEDFAGLCAAIKYGHLDTLLQDTKSFPASSFAVPPVRLSNNLRSWSLTKSDRGNYKISIIEKTRGTTDKWADATDRDQASFYAKPFDLLSMATKCLPYVESRLSYPDQERPLEVPTSVNRVVDATEEQEMGV